MPLWNIYCPAGEFSDDEKQKISTDLANLYGRVMPKFYVGVLFHEVDARNFYIGGERSGNFVRISVDHIARTMDTPEQKLAFFGAIASVFSPLIEDRNLRWELHVDETPFDLWTIQGHFPPRAGTDDERRWMSENKASARTHS